MVSCKSDSHCTRRIIPKFTPPPRRDVSRELLKKLWILITLVQFGECPVNTIHYSSNLTRPNVDVLRSSPKVRRAPSWKLPPGHEKCLMIVSRASLQRVLCWCVEEEMHGRSCTKAIAETLCPRRGRIGLCPRESSVLFTFNRAFIRPDPKQRGNYQIHITGRSRLTSAISHRFAATPNARALYVHVRDPRERSLRGFFFSPSLCIPQHRARFHALALEIFETKNRCVHVPLPALSQFGVTGLKWF